MNNIVKQLQELNRKAFIFVKRQEHKVKAHIFANSVNKKIKEYQEFNPHCTPVFEELFQDDVPDFQSLNRYLREEYDNKYPRYIEVLELSLEHTYLIHFFDMIYAEEELHGTYSGKGVVNFINMQGKSFSYAHMYIPFKDYRDLKRRLAIDMRSKYDIHGQWKTGGKVIADRFIRY